jgi:predicted metal-dependent enzyme (double-stranded beta helix superfamily)
MYGGREDNIFWRRVPKKTQFQIEAAGGLALGTGDVALLGRDVIHSVINPLRKISGAIHVYDGDFFAIGRSMWDAETLAEAPYDRNAVTKGIEIQGMPK